jgi:drug/metabolite transporter (DMT)-like permease
MGITQMTQRRDPKKRMYAIAQHQTGAANFLRPETRARAMRHGAVKRHTGQRKRLPGKLGRSQKAVSVVGVSELTQTHKQTFKLEPGPVHTIFTAANGLQATVPQIVDAQWCQFTFGGANHCRLANPGVWHDAGLSLIPTPLHHAPPRLLAYLLLALSMSLVGSYVALSKPLVSAIPVLLLAWMRFGIGGLAMPHWLMRPAHEAPMAPGIRKLVFLESLLGNFLFSICMLYGVSMTSAVSAGVIMASIPALVALLSWLFLRERIGLRVWAAVGCAAFGIGLLALSQPDSSMQAGSALEAAESYQHQLWGNLLVFGAVVCEASYAVIGKKLTGALTPKRITALINLWGFILMTPMGLYVALQFDFGALSGGTWLLLVFYALAASVWTVWLWMTGLKSVPAAKAGVFTVMLPISSALVGVLVLGETLRGLQLLAFGIALIGVVLATLPARTSRAS